MEGNLYFYEKNSPRFLWFFDYVQEKGNGLQFIILHSSTSFPLIWNNLVNYLAQVGVITMDLSKAFDSLNHELLISKLKAYGLESNSVTFMKNYLTNRLQRCKINNSVSEWGKVLNGFPQGSTLGPLLLSIFLNDISSKVWPCKLCRW